MRIGKKTLKHLLYDPREKRKAEIRNALTLPNAVLQLLLNGEKPTKTELKKAVERIARIVELIKEM